MEEPRAKNQASGGCDVLLNVSTHLASQFQGIKRRSSFSWRSALLDMMLQLSERC